MSQQPQRATAIALLLAVPLFVAAYWRPAKADDGLPASPAEAYPNRPVKVIVPFSPGGSTDRVARMIKHEVDQRNLLAQPLVVVNVEGAGSAIGSRRAKEAEPDGHTLLLLNEAIIISKYWGTVPYGPEVFEPIAGTGEVGTVITVRDDSPYQTLLDLLEDAKRRPNQITAAVAMGTPSHFACLSTQAAMPGAELRYAQLGGGAHRFAALKGGHVDISSFSTDEFKNYREQDMRALAYLGEQRNPDIPDVPTAREQGFDVQRSVMLYWWAPKGTPPDRVQAIADMLEQAMQGDSLRQRLSDASVEPVLLRGDALRAKLRQVEADAQSVDPRRSLRLPNVVLWTMLAIVVLAAWSLREALQRRAESSGPPRVESPPPESPPPESPPPGRTSQAGDSASDPALPSPAANPPHAGRVLGALALTCVFVAALATHWAPLWLAIGVFVLACGGLLGGLRSPAMAAALVAAAVVLSSGFHLLLTRLFVVDL